MTTFASFADFLAMDGHGAYVWSAYSLTLALMALNVALPLLAHHRYLNDVARGRHRESSQ